MPTQYDCWIRAYKSWYDDVHELLVWLSLNPSSVWLASARSKPAIHGSYIKCSPLLVPYTSPTKDAICVYLGTQRMYAYYGATMDQKRHVASTSKAIQTLLSRINSASLILPCAIYFLWWIGSSYYLYLYFLTYTRLIHKKKSFGIIATLLFYYKPLILNPCLKLGAAWAG